MQVFFFQVWMNGDLIPSSKVINLFHNACPFIYSFICINEPIWSRLKKEFFCILRSNEVRKTNKDTTCYSYHKVPASKDFTYMSALFNLFRNVINYCYLRQIV